MDIKEANKVILSFIGRQWDGGGWSCQDDLPESDPIGDVDPMEQFKKDDEAYMYSIQNPKPHEHYTGNHTVKLPEGQTIDFIQLNITIAKPDKCCPNPHKYKNVISNSLKFYSCSNCGADLGDIT